MLAASFAKCADIAAGSLPFIVDLWGRNGRWQNGNTDVGSCRSGRIRTKVLYRDFKTTDVALEARADLLNSLPMILDDTSKVSARYVTTLKGLCMTCALEKGKSRSNKELGMNRENKWRNAILTNGERPLSSYVTQGGAINRILEVECGENIYCDPRQR